MELGLIIMHSTPDPSTHSRAFAIQEVGIPEEVIDVLVARKLLGWAFAKSGTNIKDDKAAARSRNDLLRDVG